MNENEELSNKAVEKIKFAETLLNDLQQFSRLDGIQKLNRKIKQEMAFLKKINKTGTIKKEHLQCSNLTHFSALFEALKGIEGCVMSVGKPFNMDGGDRKLIIDIVSDNGLAWMKVIARNPKSLSQICEGNSNYGVRSILDQAREYVQCAQSYPCLFQTPKITFLFANGIGCNLASAIEALGINVEGERLLNIDADVEYETEPINLELSTANTSHINKVNLDVSTLLAYTSSVTNGSCMKYKLQSQVLAQQAEWESKRPVKQLLDHFFNDKTLYCCQTAKDNFLNILHTVGGPCERIRGEQFLQRIIVLPDDAIHSGDDVEDRNDIFNNVQYSEDKPLTVGGKIKERSLIIFSFGDRIKAVTVTSNDGFVRAAKQQGINFVVFVHESRALTEQKESKATLIEQT